MLKDFFDNESEPIVQLETFYGEKKHLVEKCLITFSKVIYDQILGMFRCTQIAEIGACNGAIPIWAFEYKNEKIAFYLTPIGSALCGGTVAEVNHITGATKFVMFGSCGTLDRDKTDGKFIVPTESYRGEGFSYYFAEAQDYITVKNSNVVADIFTELKIPFIQGRVWTTDSMIRETVNLANKRRSEGCIAVEMEVAGVQAVCDFYGWELYDFLAAGDVLMEGAYDAKELAEANHNVDKFMIGLQIAERI